MLIPRGRPAWKSGPKVAHVKALYEMPGRIAFLLAKASELLIHQPEDHIHPRPALTDNKHQPVTRQPCTFLPTLEDIDPSNFIRMSALPASGSEHVAAMPTPSLAERERACGSTTLRVLVSHEAACSSDFNPTVRSREGRKGPKVAAELKLLTSPGVGTQHLATADHFSPTLAKPKLCAATAKLLSAQMLLQLTLVFFNIRFDLESERCPHHDNARPAPDGQDVCALKTSPAEIHGIELFTLTRNNIQAEAGIALTRNDMAGSVWNLCRPL
ncbi:hypothetical protein V8E36_001747 [Tilletia maclaganii]